MPVKNPKRDSLWIDESIKAAEELFARGLVKVVPNPLMRTALANCCVGRKSSGQPFFVKDAREKRTVYDPAVSFAMAAGLACDRLVLQSKPKPPRHSGKSMRDIAKSMGLKPV